MGVTGLWKLVDGAGKQVTLESLEGKVFAVDASIILNQAVKGMKDQPNAHLHVLFLRVCKLLTYKIKPIFVFDGSAPILKRQTVAARQKRREDAAARAQSVAERLKRKAVQRLAVDEARGKSTGGKHVKPSEPDLFELPPMPQPLDEDNDIEAEEEYYELPIHSMLYSGDIDVNQIDIKGEGFKSLPLEYQHEILEEVKEHTKHNATSLSSAHNAERADQFSSLQIAKLVKSSKLTSQIEGLRKQMLSELTDNASDSQIGVLQANRVMSEDATHYLLVKHAPKTSAVHGESLVNSQSETSQTTSSSQAECLLTPIKGSTSISHQQTLLCDDLDDPELMSVETQNALIESLARDKKGVVVDKGEGDVPGGSNIKSDSPEVRAVLSSSEDEDEIPVTKSMTSAMSVSHEPTDDMTPSLKVIHKVQDDDVQTKNRTFVTPMNMAGGPVQQSKESDDDSKVPSNDGMTSIFRNQEKDQRLNVTSNSVDDCRDLNLNPPSSATPQVEALPVDPSSTGNCAIYGTADGTGNCAIYGAANSTADTAAVAAAVVANIERGSDAIQIISTDDEEESTDEESGTAASRPEQKEAGVINPVMSGLASEILEADRDLDIITEDLATNQHYLNLDFQKQQTMSQAITQQMIDDTVELLTLFGIPFVMSPSEAEAQCAKLEQLGLCNGTITEDSDAWLFGSSRVLKNFFQQDRHVTSFTSKDIFTLFGLDREKFIALALVCGSDYTDGILGAGPVTAIEIISEFGSSGEGISALRSFKTWVNSVKANGGILPASSSNSALRSKLCKHITSVPESFPNQVVVDAYLNPRVDDSNESFTWGRPDLDLLRQFAQRTLNWTSQRVDDLVCPVIKRMNSTDTQSRLSTFFNMHSTLINTSAELQSKRLKSAISKLVSASKDTTDSDKSVASTSGATTSCDAGMIRPESTEKHKISRKQPKAAAGKRKQSKAAASSKRKVAKQPPSVNIALIQDEICLSEESESSE